MHRAPWIEATLSSAASAGSVTAMSPETDRNRALPPRVASTRIVPTAETGF